MLCSLRDMEKEVIYTTFKEVLIQQEKQNTRVEKLTHSKTKLDQSMR